MRNVTKVRFSGHSATAEPLYQYDYGQILSFCGVDLPDSYEVHFAKEGDTQTVSVLGDSSGVLIPDMYLTTAKTVYAWLFLHEGEDDGETEYKVTIPVFARPEPSDIEPTPVQQDIITQAIAAMQAAQAEFDAMATADGAEAGKVLTAKTVEDDRVTEWEFTEGGGGGGGTGDYTDLTNKPKINNVTLSGNKTAADLGLVKPSDITASKSGDTTTIYVNGVAIATVNDGTDGQDGEDGYSPSASVSKSGDTATISITDKDGTTTATVTDGQDGQDGYSPTASVSKSGTTATITITDKNGTTTAQISDGTDGQDGNDGYSPTATVAKSGTTATISITDKNGTTTAQVKDGTDGQDGTTPVKGVDYFDGQDGDDGITPTTTVTTITGGHNVAFSYGSGDARNTDFDVMDGQDGTDGHTPVKGTDYWTTADKAAMVQDVLDALDEAEGVSY